MHVAILFFQIGGYHAARIRALGRECRMRGWRLTALQSVASTPSHPWGVAADLGEVPLITILRESLDGADHAESGKLAARRLPRILSDLAPDAVVVPGWGSSEARACLTWCREHRSASVCMSESKLDDPGHHWWKDLVKRHAIVRQFGAAVVGGAQHADYAARLGIPRDRIFVGYDVVDNVYFAEGSERARSDPGPVRGRLTHAPACPFFLAVTRLIPRKNVSGLISAYAMYRNDMQDEQPWDLVICGSGSEERFLKELADSLGVSNHVRLPGFSTYSTICDWYGLASAFIHPAIHEQWGLVVNEAMASGVPALCSDRVGAAAELIRDGESGLLFDPRDNRSIAAAMNRIHRMDELGRAALVARARASVAAFGPERFGAATVSAVETSIT